MRGQANLLAVPVALLLVTAAAGIALGVAWGALAEADRQPVQREATAALADGLLSPDGPVAVRRNVLSGQSLAELDAGTLRAAFPGYAGRSIRVSLDGRAIATTGSPDGGTTVRRLVYVEQRGSDRLVPEQPNGTTTLPAPSPTATVSLRPPNGTSVETLRVEGQVRRHNRSGLTDEYRLDLPDGAAATITVEANGTLPAGSVVIEYRPTATRAATLAVTVGA